MPAVDLPTGRMWYARSRAGRSMAPPALLIHGAGGSHLDWPAALRRLPQTTVIVPDLPGHGRSPGPGRQHIDAYAADVFALLDALEIEQAIVGGHSMGGAIAQTMALVAPARVAGLILIGTGARLRVHPDIMGSILSNPDQVYDMVMAWAWADGVPDRVRAMGRERLAATDPGVVHGDYLACDRFDLMAQVQAIGAPTLVIGGTADRMTPLKFSAYLADQIADATLVTVEGGGHMTILEQPHVVAGAIIAWLADRDWDVGRGDS